jgi:nucleoside-diphosphate kinase
MTERICVIAKPDAVKRGLVGVIITRFEQRGYLIKNMKYVSASRDLIEQHYAEHKGKPFYDRLVRFMTDDIVVMELEGNMQVARQIVGATVPGDSQFGSIRGDLANDISHNLVHCSDSIENARRELTIWFQ